MTPLLRCLTPTSTEMIPIIGDVISAGATYHDIRGSEGMVASHKGCMAGTH